MWFSILAPVLLYWLSIQYIAICTYMVFLQIQFLNTQVTFYNSSHIEHNSSLCGLNCALLSMLWHKKHSVTTSFILHEFLSDSDIKTFRATYCTCLHTLLFIYLFILFNLSEINSNLTAIKKMLSNVTSFYQCF